MTGELANSKRWRRSLVGLMACGLALALLSNVGPARFGDLSTIQGRVSDLSHGPSFKGRLATWIQLVDEGGQTQTAGAPDEADYHDELQSLAMGQHLKLWLADAIIGVPLVWQIERDGRVLIPYDAVVTAYRRRLRRNELVGWLVVVVGAALYVWSWKVASRGTLDARG